MIYINVGGKKIDIYYILLFLGFYDGVLYIKGKMLKKLLI